MQEQKTRENKTEDPTVKSTSKTRTYGQTETRRTSTKDRFLNVFNNKLEDHEYVAGVSVILLCTTFSILMLVSLLPPLSIAGSMIGGSVLGLLEGKLVNDKLGLFEDRFDFFTSALFQILLLWMTIPVLSLGSISLIPVIASTLIASILLPLLSSDGRMVKHSN